MASPVGRSTRSIDVRKAWDLTPIHRAHPPPLLGTACMRSSPCLALAFLTTLVACSGDDLAEGDRGDAGGGADAADGSATTEPTVCDEHGTRLGATFSLRLDDGAFNSAVTLEGVATATITGERIEIGFEDGRRIGGTITGTATLRLPTGQRWRAVVTYDTFVFVPKSSIVLRALDGPAPGALRFAVWDTGGSLPDVAPLVLRYRRETCDRFDGTSCGVTAPQTLLVDDGTGEVPVSRHHRVDLGGARVANGGSFHIVEERCTDQNPRVQGFIDAP